LNSLLTILNERRFASGSEVVEVPLIALYGATNEVPNDDSMAAIFDRFLLRVRSNNLDSYHFQNLLERGVENELRAMSGRQGDIRPLLSAANLRALHRSFDRSLKLSEELVARYKGLIFQIRSEGITMSDRRVIKLTKLLVASALLDGRAAPHDGDFFILKHV